MLFYHPSYSSLSLPPKHRFPIEKYHLLYQQLLQTPCANWLTQPTVVASFEQLSLCHDPEYVAAFLNGMLASSDVKRMGFPWSERLVERTLHSVGAALEAAQLALSRGFAANLSGGYHHAFSDRAAGFCIFNDLAIAARHLIRTGQADSVLLLDCDVHQGDGSAEILAADPQIITCSLHCEQNFPKLKQQSDYDFALPKGSSDEVYLATLNEALGLCTRLHQPDIILYNAGADIYHHDELGHFDISLDGVLARDTLVLKHAKRNHIPLMATLGGGYQRNVGRLVDVHLQLFIALQQVWPERFVPFPPGQ
ncbi:histone deacetylase [Pseudoalteromonas sp. OOF1S-7]|uniref:histone deacetylase family protein n=1 Tax=Pseudoalteromonas sp. OOF1S-7 TaxID=2917757 RepID=UPI001EF6AE24|nr:histone deacetylase [Pseudoalteromonas sp. OOF1S-7]MCG7533832.1 histone deacetylase [Pseudoalteromonas sp. OOF1S-7]